MNKSAGVEFVDRGIEFIDRATGARVVERVHADGFLRWAYNTESGSLALRLLFRRKWFSRAYGWWHDQRWSASKIARFVEAHDVRIDEALGDLEDFRTFNEFFTREIDLSKRPLDPDPNACLAPVDGRVLAYAEVHAGQTFQIKRGVFNLNSLLADDGLAERCSGGSMIVSRVHLSDYHHFHFPDSGTPAAPRSIPGVYDAVSPYAQHRLVPFYAENHRMVTPFGSDHFGPMVMVEVGAMTVGSIRQCFTARAPVARGDRKGFFELGGSTVVLLFEPGAMDLAQDLLDNTDAGLETYVRMGDSLGRARKFLGQERSTPK